MSQRASWNPSWKSMLKQVVQTLETVSHSYFSLRRDRKSDWSPALLPVKSPCEADDTWQL